jgi:hypothetical protein
VTVTVALSLGAAATASRRRRWPPPSQTPGVPPRATRGTRMSTLQVGPAHCAYAALRVIGRSPRRRSESAQSRWRSGCLPSRWQSSPSHGHRVSGSRAPAPGLPGAEGSREARVQVSLSRLETCHGPAEKSLSTVTPYARLPALIRNHDRPCEAQAKPLSQTYGPILNGYSG